MLAMLPRWTSSPSTKPSTWLPGFKDSDIASGSALQAPRGALRQSRRAYLPRRAPIVVRHAIEREPRSLAIREGIAGLVAAIARLAGGADDRQPLTMLRRRNGRAGHGAKQQRFAVGAHVVQLLLVHVAADHEARVRRAHALARFAQAGDVDPLSRSRGARMHEQHVRVPDGQG